MSLCRSVALGPHREGLDTLGGATYLHAGPNIDLCRSVYVVYKCAPVYNGTDRPVVRISE